MDARYVGRCPRCGGRVLDAGRLYADRLCRQLYHRAIWPKRLDKHFRLIAMSPPHPAYHLSNQLKSPFFRHKIRQI